MAPRELFTLAITSEVRLWSMTKAMESGNGSTVNSRSGSRCSFSKTLKSRYVRPATSFPLLSFTVTGTSTKFTFTTNRAVDATPSPATGCSGGVAWNWSFGWLAGAWLLGAGCCAGPDEDELAALGASPAPLPGVIELPSAPDNGTGACGVGASGTEGCCWAKTAVHKLELRVAANAIAIQPSFTGISSSPNAAQSANQAVRGSPQNTGNRQAGLHPTDYQTRRSPAGCPAAEKRLAYALLEV